MKPRGDNSDRKFVSTWSKKSILGHYKGVILDCGEFFVHKVNINMYMRPLAIVLSI